MRRFLIGLVVAFLVTIGILDIVFTNKSFENVKAEAIELSEILKQEKNDLALEKAYNLEKTWQEEMKWMQVFIMYAEIKPISEKIARIVSLIELKNDEALIEVDALIIEIQDVHEIYKFTLPNLF